MNNHRNGFTLVELGVCLVVLSMVVCVCMSLLSSVWLDPLASRSGAGRTTDSVAQLPDFFCIDQRPIPLRRAGFRDREDLLGRVADLLIRL